MSESKNIINSEQKIFEQLILEFEPNSDILKIGQFFESQDEENEVYLVHSIRNFEYREDTNTIAVAYICEKINSEEREKFDVNERYSLMNAQDELMISFNFDWENIQTEKMNSLDLLYTISYQQDEGRIVPFLLKEIEYIDFVEEEEKLFLQVYFNVRALLPIPENEKKQILNILRKSKSKFNFIKQ